MAAVSKTDNVCFGGAVCEHARSLREVPETPKVQTRIMQKVALDDSDYTNFNDLMETLRREILPTTAEHTKEHIDHIKSILAKVRINDREWRQYTNFTEVKYTRNLVGHDEKFTALLLCWNKGQASPIHDHAGSSCWVKVLSGNLEETMYEPVDKTNPEAEGLRELGTAIVGKEQSCYINDSMGFHRVANPSRDDVLVTLHIYSPPFTFCNVFDPQGHSRRANMLAANAPYESFFEIPKEGESHGEGSFNEFSLKLEDISQKQIKDPVALCNTMMEAISQLRMTRHEWGVYTHFSEFRYTRNLLFSNSDFTVILNCWMPGQATPVHTHGNGTHSWFRVVGGELTMEFFDEDRKPRSSMVFRTDSPPFFEGVGMHLHSLSNKSDQLAVSIHVYNPPYKQLTYQDPQDKVPKCLPVVHCRRGERCCDSNSGSASCEAVFTNLTSMVQMMTSEFEKKRCPAERNAEVMGVLERCIFNEEEIEALLKLRDRKTDSLLLHKTNEFVVEVNFWDRGFVQPIHDHGNSSTWGKVLRGKLSDITYAKGDDTQSLEVTHSALLLQGSMFFLGKGTRHSLRNGPVCDAVSIHVTSPPIVQCNYFSVSGQTVPQWFVFV